jgi:hypothetical protein
MPFCWTVEVPSHDQAHLVLKIINKCSNNTVIGADNTYHTKNDNTYLNEVKWENTGQSMFTFCILQTSCYTMWCGNFLLCCIGCCGHIGMYLMANTCNDQKCELGQTTTFTCNINIIWPCKQVKTDPTPHKQSADHITAWLHGCP